MTLPFTLPSWLPWWLTIVILVPALLWALAFLAMPFNVFGVKGRLDVIEARLDEIQGEIRSLALRLPEPVRSGGFDEVYASPPMLAPLTATQVTSAPETVRPPIPPAPQDWDRPDRDALSAPVRPRRADTGARQMREEPRLGRPR